METLGKSNSIPGPQLGVPIGLSASAIAANVLLHKWDVAITRRVNPIFYGRYVDDMFLVLRDPGNIESSAKLMVELARSLDGLLEETPNRDVPSRTIKFEDSYQGQSRLELQDGKRRAFFIEGQRGLDLLESIEKEIVSIASERRLMPVPDELDRSPAARVLTAASTPNEEADTLRRAEGLSVRRLGWSLQLRNAETLSYDLSPDSWKRQRTEFYDFARNHILRPDRLLDHADYLPRLVGIAISLGEFTQAKRLIEAVEDSLKTIQNASPIRVTVNGNTITPSPKIWEDALEGLLRPAREAVLGAYPGMPRRPGRTSKAMLDKLALEWENARTTINQLREADLARVSYKAHIRVASPRIATINEELLLSRLEHTELRDLKEFLQKSRKRRLRDEDQSAKESLLPLLFATRPYSTREITALVPECVKGDGQRSSLIWAKFVRAVRGVWVRPALLDEAISSSGGGSDSGGNSERAGLSGELAGGGAGDGNGDRETSGVRPWRIGQPRRAQKVRIAITSLLTRNEAWARSAAGNPDHSLERYSHVARLINNVLQTRPLPEYILLPEVSIPERWIDSIANRVVAANVSLAAGVEYTHRADGRIFSEACLILTDDRLGYPASVEIRQVKTSPAPGEDADLLRIFGKQWIEPDPSPKPIYDHRGFCFGVLVCSELQSIQNRERFQGKVDSVIPLCQHRVRQRSLGI